MGALVNPVVDPISKQPESKHTPVRIKAYQPVWQGFILSRRELTVTGSEYRVKIKGEQFYRYELAGETLPEDWRSCVRKICAEPLPKIPVAGISRPRQGQLQGGIDCPIISWKP